MNKKLAIIIGIILAAVVLLGYFERAQTTIFKNHTSDNVPTDKSLEDFYKQAQNLLPQNPTATTTLSFLAVGDINLSRNVADAIKKSGDEFYAFRGMQDVLHNTTFNFGNLESPFSQKPIIGGHSLIFGASSSTIEALIENKFNILNLANNHALDGGLEDLNFTKKLLDQNGIKYMGTGNNLDEAWQPAVVEQNGMKICFVGASYASVNDGGKSTNNYVARMEDLDRLKTAITSAKSKCDFVVATMHGGVEYTRTPNDLQIQFAHAAIDDGADIVIGAHPHWVQTIEKYNGRWIFYSLGNFIFDQAFSQDTSEGLTLKITLSKNISPNNAAPKAATLDDLQGQRQPAQIDSIELMPIVIRNSQPRPATADETKKNSPKNWRNKNTLKIKEKAATECGPPPSLITELTDYNWLFEFEHQRFALKLRRLKHAGCIEQDDFAATDRCDNSIENRGRQVMHLVADARVHLNKVAAQTLHHSVKGFRVRH